MLRILLKKTWIPVMIMRIKTMNKILLPTLDVIKRNLFTPSDALVTQWVEQPETLSMETRQDLESSELAQQEKQSYLESKKWSSDNKETIIVEPVPNALSQLPDHIRKLIQRQCDAAKHTFSDLPHSGLIVLINEAIGPEGSLQLDMANPMVVLLNKPTTHKLVWEGWVVASETDYASYWDMLFDAEEDAPLDPLVGMVQVWNSVKVYLPSIEKTIGELIASRLELVRTLANEYHYGDKSIEDTQASELGVINLRKINHRYLLTGTPLSGEDDPRWQYQELYYEAANVIRIPAGMAEDVVGIPTIHTSSIDQPLPEKKSTLTTATIDTRIQYLPNTLRFVSKVQNAMGENDDQCDIIWQNTYRIIRTSEEIEGMSLYHFVIRLEKTANIPITFEYRENGEVHHKHTFTHDKPETNFPCDPQTNYELRVMDHASNASVLTVTDFEEKSNNQ